jgi:hypothetical protein
MEQSKLQLIKDIIATKEVGEVLTRKEIRKAAGTPPQWSMGTYDTYRNLFCKAGYLKWVGNGEYQKLKGVEESLTYDELFKLAYPNSRKQ